MSYITHQRGTQELFENRMKSKNISEWILHLLFVVLLVGGAASQVHATVYTFDLNATDSISVDGCDPDTYPEPYWMEHRISAGFHSSIMIRPDGMAVSWGQASTWNKSNVGTPTVVTLDGTTPYVGKALEVDICGAQKGGGSPLLSTLFLRTTTNLYAWGESKGGLTAGNIQNVVLPTGVTVADITKMEASGGGLALLANGNVWIKHGYTTDADSYGDGSAAVDTTWHQVETAVATPLANVKDLSYSGQVAAAILTDGTIYTWGKNTFLGEGSAGVDRSRATQMTLPGGVTANQLKVHHDLAGTSSYALVGTDGFVYVMGNDIENVFGGATAGTTWGRVLTGDQADASGFLSNIVYININDVDTEPGAVNANGVGALASDGSFFTWGNNSQSMLSGTASYATPHSAEFAEAGKQGTLVFFDIGGHTSAAFPSPGEFCYAGHYVNGSIGNDPELDDPTSTLETFTCGLNPAANLIPSCVLAVADDFTGTSIIAGTGGAAGNILTNDTLNGDTATATTVSFSLNTPPTGITVDAAGLVSVDNTVSAGTYDVNYTICEITSPLLSPPNCSEPAFITIAVKPTSGAVLTLKKVVDNTAGGSATTADFNLTYTATDALFFFFGGTITGTGISGSSAVTNVAVPQSGIHPFFAIVSDYTMTETAVANYTASLTCTGSADADPSDGLTLSTGEVVVCTFTNTYTVAAGPTAPTVVSQTTNDSTPTITGTLDSVDTISVIVNGETYTEGDGNLTDNTDGTWTLTIPTANAIPDGTYDVNATVTDGDSNTASDATTDELIIDTVAPTPTPTVDALVTNDTTPTITGDANSSATLTVTVDGVTYTEGDGNLTDVGDDTWTLTIPVALTTDTTYDVNATLTDDANNTSSDGTTGELIIDTSITTPTVTTQTTSDTTPTITGTADSADTLTVEVNGTIYTEGDGNLTDNTDGTWTLTIPAANVLATDTNYSVIATVVDVATNTAVDVTSNELRIDSAAITSPCGDTVTLMTAEKWYSVSRPCGLVTNPTVAELFNAAPGLGVYGDNWGLWKLDGTNPGYNNSEEHTLLASDAEVMKSGVGYWMWSDTNVTWDPGAIALAANAIGTNWHVPTVDTNTTAELNITDPDVSAFYVVTPTADLESGLIRDVQEVLMGNPFNKPVTWENVYFSDDNGTTYKRADDNTTAGIRSTAWVTNQDHTGNEVYPYEVISTTVGFTHTIDANQAFWIEVNGGYFAHPSERLAIPLEN